MNWFAVGQALGFVCAGSPGVLLIAFVVSFVPLGLYFLGNPSSVCWIGVAELGYLVAATVLYHGRSQGETAR